METNGQIREQMEAIQRALRRSGREMVLPSAQALVRGLLVLAGCGVNYLILDQPPWRITLLWTVVLVLILVVETALYVRLLKRDREKFITGIERQMVKFLALIIALVVILTIALVARGQSDLAPSLWMLLIGTAYVTVGLFSFSDTWILGLFICLGGTVALFLPLIGALAVLALTLGVGSIAWAVVGKVRERRLGT